ncbi:hypothetical protein [Leucobacter aridicollis]|uniref:Uncharacterized protein n=1 Tax=Leucobacter aridicollis TaxID=283878 RepID=A0A852QYZ2_9MICO|nr:hypothetical protein [Leucobacter aridicollis]NYD25407.1 hypothetical protein [Leucobacter aridicollis]
MQGKVTMSQAYELGSASESTSRRLIEELAELYVSMTTSAMMDRGSDRTVLHAGVVVADGLQLV